MLFEHIKRLYIGKAIGFGKVIHAYNNGWITKQQLEELRTIVVSYTKEEATLFKMEECSYLCHEAISKGIDVVLSDEKVHHFSLSSNDQNNLNAKMLNILAGVTELEYHSDGEPCVYYSVEDMTTICTSAQSKITIETTYNNCLYQWIKRCQTVDEIMTIRYGMEIPEEYWSEPWRNIVVKLENAKNIHNDQEK